MISHWMERLSIDDIRTFEITEPSKGPAPEVATTSDASQSFRVGKNGVDLAQLIPDLTPGQSLFIPSEGLWSLHETIEYLFARIGAADLTLSSWGLTEKPLEKILHLVRTGIALNPKFLLDFRVKLQSASAYQLLLASGLDIRLTQNHSKVVVLRNKQHGITVITSSNLTQNPRLEFYVISTDPAIADQCHAWLSRMHTEGQPLT